MIHTKEHIHTPDDGRGFDRRVLIDGCEIKYVVYANTRTGVVQYYVRDLNGQFKLNKKGNAVLKRWMHGDSVSIVSTMDMDAQKVFGQ